MIQTCPISQKRVDTNISRLVSSFAALSTLLFLITDQTFFIFLLFYDFSMRLFQKQKFSPFFQISTFVAQSFSIKPQPTDEAPKRFALTLGWIMTLLIVLFHLISMQYLTTFFVVTLFVCTLLEAVLDFCIGCKIHQIITMVKND